MLNDVPLTAVDFGSSLWLSRDGASAERPRNHKRFLCLDHLSEVAAGEFDRGRDLVLEAPTKHSYAVRQQYPALQRLLARYPERHLRTVPSRQARNQYRRETGKPYPGHLPDDEAVCLIWRVAMTQPTKIWHPDADDQAMRPYRVDPLRVLRPFFVSLREAGYPNDRMQREVWRFVDGARFSPGQRQIFMVRLASRGYDWHRPRIAALVYAVREPSARTRPGFLRVIGASASGHPNIYRQHLVVGTPDNDGYVHKRHFSGLSMTDAMREIRNLRSAILREYPEARDLSDLGM